MATEQPNKPGWQDFLSQVGISSDFAQKVRFRGPVGKLALVGVVALACIGGVGVRSGTDTVHIICLILATVIVLFVAAGILWYSDKHPNEATLEGMEVIVYHQQKAWAAKGLPNLPDTPIIPNPGGMPPQLNPPEGVDQ